MGNMPNLGWFLCATQDKAISPLAMVELVALVSDRTLRI